MAEKQNHLISFILMFASIHLVRGKPFENKSRIRWNILYIHLIMNMQNEIIIILVVMYRCTNKYILRPKNTHAVCIFQVARSH